MKKGNEKTFLFNVGLGTISTKKSLKILSKNARIGSIVLSPRGIHLSFNFFYFRGHESIAVDTYDYTKGFYFFKTDENLSNRNIFLCLNKVHLAKS
ncbi:hypothetical protein AM499_05445 [Bacillus sp. FJAT-22090]|nr:hypothetical protein AM499_05445 [Bacillus sp. FJAT-22090]